MLRIFLLILCLLVTPVHASRGPYIGPSLLVQQISANQSRYRDFHPRLSAGYAALTGNNYLAGEVFLSPTTIAMSDTKNPGATSAGISRNFGASIIPGHIFMPNMMGYGRLGLIMTKFTTPDQYKTGTQLGLGIQSKLSQYLVLRGEYTNTIYGPVSGVGTPNSSEIGIGLLYWFDEC